MLTSHTIKAQSRVCACVCVSAMRVFWCEVWIIAFSGGFTEPRRCFLQTGFEGLFMLLRGGDGGFRALLMMLVLM